MKKIVTVPEDIIEKLVESLQLRYPEAESSEKAYRSISYNLSKEPNAKYDATVTYHWGNSSSTALFTYTCTFDEKIKNYKYYWYCRKDWLD